MEEPLLTEEDTIVKELEMLELGQHPMYLERIKQLQEEKCVFQVLCSPNRELREWMIEQWESYSISCCDGIVQHGAEEFQTKLHVRFTSFRITTQALQNDIKENLIRECTEQRRKLEDAPDQPQRPGQDQRPMTRRLLRTRRKDDSFLDDNLAYQSSCGR